MNVYVFLLLFLLFLNAYRICIILVLLIEYVYTYVCVYLYLCLSLWEACCCFVVVCLYYISNLVLLPFHYMANRDKYTKHTTHKKTETDSGNNTIALEQKQVLLYVFFFFLSTLYLSHSHEMLFQWMAHSVLCEFLTKKHITTILLRCYSFLLLLQLLDFSFVYVNSILFLFFCLVLFFLATLAIVIFFCAV